MNTEPLKEYLKARDALKEGREEEALNMLTSSLGFEKPTDIIKESYARLLNLDDVALAMVLARSKE